MTFSAGENLADRQLRIMPVGSGADQYLNFAVVFRSRRLKIGLRPDYEHHRLHRNDHDAWSDFSLGPFPPRSSATPA
jgi:hypothetical protein